MDRPSSPGAWSFITFLLMRSRSALLVNTIHENTTVSPSRALAAALKKNKAAAKTFDAFSYSAKKEYIEWIEEAKTDATVAKRVATAVEWIAEGKQRNWKYQ